WAAICGRTLRRRAALFPVRERRPRTHRAVARGVEGGVVVQAPRGRSAVAPAELAAPGRRQRQALHPRPDRAVLLRRSGEVASPRSESSTAVTRSATVAARNRRRSSSPAAAAVT